MTKATDCAPSPSAKAEGGLAGRTAAGTGWTTAQGLLNKLATTIAMYIIALKLTPDEFGMASLVVAVGGFLILLPPLVMGDVLISHQRRFATLAGVGGRMAWRVGICTAIGIVLVAPLVAGFYSKYPFALLVGLLMVMAARPLGDAAAVIPLSRLRMDLRYRSIALVDGSVQFAATLATVVLAFMGAGALSLVCPQVAAIVVKAICYRMVVSSALPVDGAPGSEALRPLVKQRASGRVMREFSAAAGAQYVHTLLSNLPVLVLARLTDESQTGLFGFAFVLANQANFVISYQLGTVLQPVFGKLKSDPARQAQGFLRVVRAIGALAVPLSFLQAALAQPLFQLVFAEKWWSAAPIFSVLCIGQAFYFAMAPAMALLKAQGRFQTYFIWQASQLAASLLVYPIMALAGGAIAVAWTDTAAWGLSVPLAVWLGTRNAGGTPRQALALFAAPSTTAAPIALAAWGAWLLLEPLGVPGMALAIFIVGPVALVLSILGTRISQPATYEELRPMVGKFATRLGKLPRTLLLGVARGER